MCSPCLTALQFVVRTGAEASPGCRILGVPVSAPVSQIKQTYYKTIRDCHPDITGEADDEATEFCVFLNEIYEASSPGACWLTRRQSNLRG